MSLRSLAILMVLLFFIPAVGFSLPIGKVEVIPFSAGRSASAEVSVFYFDEEEAGRSGVGRVIELPMPDGLMASFAVRESPVVAPELAESLEKKGVLLKTYALQGVSDPSMSGRMQLGGELGLGAFLQSQSGDIWIHRLNKKIGRYRSGYLKDISPANQPFSCIVRGANDPMPDLFPEPRGARNVANEVKTFRMAMVPHGTMLADFGNDRDLMDEWMITMTNYLNQIYIREMSIQFELIAESDTLLLPTIGDEATFDAWNNRDVLLEIIDRSTEYLFDEVGAAKFDIGHVLMRSPAAFLGGGAASTGVCRNIQGVGGKADGGSATDRLHSLNPNDILGDTEVVRFWTDIIAHEIGHQFSAQHTFSSNGPFCADQFSSSSSYEPGSGTTIMSYAGSCGEDNVQGSSDPFFHARSIQEMTSYINGTSCFTTSPTGNSSKPVITALPNRTVPGNAPLMLFASASDGNSDESLTYTWEQFDRLNSPSAYDPNRTTGPVMRSFPPVSSPVRSIPQLGRLALGQEYPFETIPSVSRDLNFILTVRDNHSAGGLTEQSQVRVTVDTNRSNLKITAPISGETLDSESNYTVRWDSNGVETLAGAEKVDVMYFTSFEAGIDGDSGLEFLVLERDIPTEAGMANVVIPDETITNGVIVVKASDSYFFDAVPNVSSETPPPPEYIVTYELLEVFGNGNSLLGNGERWKIAGRLENLSDTEPLEEVSFLPSTTFTDIRLLDKTTILVPDIHAGSSWSFEILFDVAEDARCSLEARIHLNFTLNGSYFDSLPISIFLGAPNGNCDDPYLIAPGAEYCGSTNVPLPPGQSVSDSIVVTESGEVNDLQVKLKLRNDYMGDLWVNLVHDGVSRSLFINLGGVDCQAPYMDVTFRIDATLGIQQVCPSGSTTPIIGDFVPNQPLSDFFDLDVNGEWRLDIIDQVKEDGGVLESWCLIINGGDVSTDAWVFE